jgi:hypothetical protein
MSAGTSAAAAAPRPSTTFGPVHPRPVTWPDVAPIARVALADAVADRLYFAQVREDPRAELEALRPRPDETVVVVSSGGCTALSLLAAGAGRVVAVDRNAAQNHLVELKAAAAALGAREAVAFLGALPASDRAAVYATLRTALTPARPRVLGRAPAGRRRRRARRRGERTFHRPRRRRAPPRRASAGARRPDARVPLRRGAAGVVPARVGHVALARAVRVLCNRLAFRSAYPPQFFAGAGHQSFAHTSGAWPNTRSPSCPCATTTSCTRCSPGATPSTSPTACRRT